MGEDDRVKVDQDRQAEKKKPDEPGGEGDDHAYESDWYEVLKRRAEELDEEQADDDDDGS